jgi:hypothetical protein
MFQNVPNCFKNVSKCSKSPQNVSKCSKMFQNVSKCFTMVQNVPNCFETSQGKILGLDLAAYGGGAGGGRLERMRSDLQEARARRKPEAKRERGPLFYWKVNVP